jgi:translation elongation factor EF-1beta
MSDANRKNISQQLKEKITPESEKTTFQKVKEHVSDGIDRVKAAITPEQHKSTTQQIADKIRDEHDKI